MEGKMNLDQALKRLHDMSYSELYVHKNMRILSPIFNYLTEMSIKKNAKIPIESRKGVVNCISETKIMQACVIMAIENFKKNPVDMVDISKDHIDAPKLKQKNAEGNVKIEFV